MNDSNSKPSNLTQKLLERIARFFFGKVLPRGWTYPIVHGPLRGMKFISCALAGEGGGARVYFGMVEPEQTRIFYELVNPGSVVFDIGANVGYYTLLGSRRVGLNGKVVAFEPVVRNLFFLQKHITSNHLQNVIIAPVACSDQSTPRRFLFGENCALGHFEWDNEPRSTMSLDMTVVGAATIDEVVQLTHLVPDVVKIDVEGAEFEVLKGASETLKRISPKILLSVHSDTLRIQCIDFLKKHQYSCSPLEGDSADANEWLGERF